MSKAIIVLLDSLNKTNSTEGVIGGEQMKWLSEALAMNKNKPTIIMVHHNPVFGGDVSGALVDTKALFDVIVPEKQVKMVIFGHTHRFEAKEHEGIHLLNLPPVAYPFNEKDPTGWVEMHLAKTGVDITLNALNKHAMNGKSMQFRWRV